MKLRLMSDLHREFFFTGWSDFVKSLDLSLDEYLVIAGDLCSHTQLKHTIPALAKRVKGIIYTLGNHEFYFANFDKTFALMNNLSRNVPNLFWLEQKRIVIEGQGFCGATLWFARPKIHSKAINDFYNIEGFEKRVYDINRESVQFFKDSVQPGDICVTHHMPGSTFVGKQYEGSSCNPYFYSEMMAVVRENKPKLWHFAHTHLSIDRTIDGTRFVCNPHGYRLMEENSSFNKKLIVEA